MNKKIKLTFPLELVEEPVVYRMAKKYDVVPNIFRANITETTSEMVLELEGDEQKIEKAIEHLTNLGVKVEPIVKRKVKLAFTQELIKEPIAFRMANRFDIVPNIRRARVTETLGELVLELEGVEKNLEKGLQYLDGLGVRVEPAEGDLVE